MHITDSFEIFAHSGKKVLQSFRSVHMVFTQTIGLLSCQQASQSSIHSSVHPSREADSSSPVAQDRASLQGTVAGIVTLSCLAFPRLALVPYMPALWASRPASLPVREPASIQTAGQPAIHLFIHLSG